MMLRRFLILLAGASAVMANPVHARPPASSGQVAPASESAPKVAYRSIDVRGIKIFYREAGAADAPVLLLLHGFPTSSHMYRDLIPELSRNYRVIAPDYPGYGFSDAPSTDQFAYTFSNIATIMTGFIEAKGLARYALFMQDFGGPIGFRIAAAHPDRVSALIIQNANAYEEGFSDAMNAARPAWQKRTAETEAAFRDLLTLAGTKQQYLAGVSDPALVSPDAWTHAQAGLDRPGNEMIQQSMLHDYGSNPALYPQWQAYLRDHQPPVLVTWGNGDPFFLVEGANAYARDVTDAEIHILPAGHFALETHHKEIAALVSDFLGRKIQR